MWLLAWEFLFIKRVLHFAFLHLLSGYYYYGYVLIDVLRPSWFTKILFWIVLLLSKELKQLKIIIIIIILDYIVILSRVHSVIYRRASPQPLKPEAPCSPNASGIYQGKEHVRLRWGNIDVSGPIVGNPKHNFRWGDKTSFFLTKISRLNAN